MHYQTYVYNKAIKFTSKRSGLHPWMIMMFKNLQIKLESFNEIQQDFRVSKGTRSNLVPSPFQVLVYYPASRGFSLVFLSVVLPFSSRFWLLAFCFGCFCAGEKTSADSRLGFLLSMREMKMGLQWNFWVTCR